MVLPMGKTVYYSSMDETLIGGLIDTNDYIVFGATTDSFQLKLKTTDTTVVDITSVNATGLQSFSYLNTSKTKTITISDNTIVNNDTDTITLTAHGFETGDLVYYQVTSNSDRNTTKQYAFIASSASISTDTIKLEFGDGLILGATVVYNPTDNTTITGLVAGRSYIVDTITPCAEAEVCAVVKLRETAANGGSLVTFGAITNDPVNTSGTVYTPVHAFNYTVTQTDVADNAISGLNDGVYYFVVKVDDNHIRLVSSQSEALELANGIELDASSVSGSGHSLDTGMVNGIGVVASLISVEENGVGAGIGQSQTPVDMLSNSVSSKAKTIVMSIPKKILEFLKTIYSKISGKTSDEETKKAVADASDPSTINVTGSLGIIVSIHTVRASVGPNAVLKSGKDIMVLARQEDTWQTEVDADTVVTEDSGGSRAALGGALSTVVLLNNVQAVIEAGAHVDAMRDLVVKADMVYPFRLKTFISNVIQSSLGSLLGMLYADSLASDFNFHSHLFNTWVRAGVDGGGDTSLALAGAINIIYQQSDVAAIIGDNVQINQTLEYQTAYQNVSVKANTYGRYIIVTGNFALSLQPGLESGKKLQKIKDYFKGLPGSVFSPFGSSGGKNGIGGSVTVPILISDTIAEIGNGVKIHIGDTGKLIVDALTDYVMFTLTQAGTKAGTGFGIAGAISYTGIFSNTLARIGSTSKVVGGSASITAADESLNINVVGAVAVGQSMGVGVSIAINTLVRNVNALVGNRADGAAGPWQIDYTGTGTQPSISVEVIPAFNGSGLITTATHGSVNTYEVQRIETNAYKGSFTLSYLTGTTVDLAYNASASAVETALNNLLASLGRTERVSVTGGSGDAWEVTFNTYGKKDWITGSAYTGGSETFTGRLTTTSTNGSGSSYEVQSIQNDSTGNNLFFTYGSNTSTAIAYDASATVLEAALELLGTGDITVTKPSVDTWKITFNTTGDKSAIGVTFTAEVTTAVYIEGAVNTREKQHLSTGGATQGAYELYFNDERSLPFLYSATAAEIKIALDALQSVKDTMLDTNGNGIGYVTVTGSDGEFDIEFGGFGDVEDILFEALSAFQGTSTVETGVNTYNVLHSSHRGAFLIDVNGTNSAILPFDATTAQVSAALNAILPGKFTVTALAGDTASPSFDLLDGLLVKATATGHNWTFSLAAAVTRDEKKPASTEPSQTKGSGMPRKHWQETLLVKLKLAGQNFPAAGSSSTTSTQQGAKNSLAVAGDMSINVGIDKVEAAIRDAGLIVADTIEVIASNTSTIRAAAGSAAINTNGSSNSVGIAGSVAFNWLDGFTRAIIQNTKITQNTVSAIDKGKVNVTATRSGDIFALAAGGAGAPKEKGIAIAGSVAVSIIRNITEAIVNALLSGSTLAGGLNIHATDNSGAITIAGALAYGGKVGVGAAFAVSLILSETRALLENSIFTHARLLSVIANSTGRIITGAGALGASKGKVGVGGTVAINLILSTVEAIISNVSTALAIINGAAEVKADNTSTIYSFAGAVGGGETAGVGVAISFNYLDPDIRAAIVDSQMHVGDTNTGTTDISSLVVHAKNDGSIETASAGGAGSSKVAVAGALSVNLVLTEVEAYIAGITTNIKSAGNILISAEDDSDIHSFAGNVAGAGKVAVGASISYNWSASKVSAYIKHADVESLRGDILVSSISSGEMIALAAGGQGAGNVSVGGSVTIGYIGNTIKAYIIGASDTNRSIVTAYNSVGVAAKDSMSSVMVAGVVGGAGTVAVGVANTTMITANLVEAYIGEYATVKGKGKKNTSQQVYTGSTQSAGAWQQVAMRGVWVTAVSEHSLRSFAVGGTGAGTAAVSASATLTTVVDNVSAHIDSTASVTEEGTDSEDDLSGVNVFAAGSTVLWGVAGALAGAGTVGVGVGVDIGVLTKTVEAYVAGSITAAGNIIVQAISSEEIISVSASLGAAGTVGIAGSFGIYTLILNTLAHVDGTAVLYAVGSILVNANDNTSVILTAGSISGAGTVGVGASVDVSVTVKNIRAYIADGAQVDAEGNGDPIVSFSGAFVETWTEDPRATFTTSNVSSATNKITITGHGFETGDMVTYTNGTTNTDPITGWLTNGGTYYVIADDVNTIRLATSRENALAGIAVDLNTASASGTSFELEESNVVQVERPTFTPETAINNTNHTITMTGHGYTTGQALVYSAGGDTAIIGLEEGQTYYVIAVDANTIQLALNQVDASNGDEIEISNTGITGANHSLWTGTIDEVNPNVTTPGPQFGSNLNNDNDNRNDVESDQNILTKTRSVTPATVLVRGIVVSALNRDVSLTFAVSGGGAGTVAVNVSGLTNYMGTTVDAHIGDADINQHLTGDAHSGQNVEVLAGNDYFHIGVATAGNGAGVVSVTPEADIAIVKNNVYASIGDGAVVSAAQNVIVDAHANTLIASVSVGVTGSGMVSVAGSLSVITVVNNTKAWIGDADSDLIGATVTADGNVYVNATDDMDVILVAGALGLGFGAVGVGASIGVLVETKNTMAFIGSYSVVNGLANGTGLTDMVYKNRMDTDGSFSTYGSSETVKGVIVQAYSNDMVITVAGAGAGGFYTGVAGAIIVDVFLTNTYAYIGAHAQVNQLPGAGTDQDVIVTSLNHAWIFDFAGAVGGGIVGIGGAIEVNVMRHNAYAYIGDYASVSAASDVLVAALNNKDLIVVAASLGGGAVGVGLVFLVNVVGSEFTTHYSVSYSETDVNEDGTNNNTYDENIDKDPLEENDVDFDSSLNNASGMKNNINSELAGYNNSSDPTLYDTLDDNDIDLSGLEASGNDSLSGTIVYIGTGAVITTGTGSIDLYAEERISFIGAAGTINAGAAAFGAAISVNVVGSNVEAYVEGGAELNSGDDINIQSYLITDMSGWAIAGNLSAAYSVGGQVVVFTDHSNQRASLGIISTNTVDAVTINYAGDILVMASANRTILADSSGINVSFTGTAIGLSIAVSSISGETLAYTGLVNVGQHPGQYVSTLTVKAVSDIYSKVFGLSANAGATAGVGGAILVNVTNPKSTAFIGKGSKIYLTGALVVTAIARAKAWSLAMNANAGSVAGGLNVAVTTMSPSVTAYIGKASDDTTASMATVIHAVSVLIRTIYNYNDDGTQIVDQGSIADSYGGSIGIGAIQGDISVARSVAKVHTYINDNVTLVAASSVQLLSMVYNQAKSIAVGVTGGAIAVSVNFALALTANSEYQAFINNAVIHAGSLTINNHVTEKASATVTAATISLYGGTINVAVSKQSPKVYAFINGSNTSITTTGNATIAAQYDANADSLAFGVSVAYGVSIAASVGITISNPEVKAYIQDGDLIIGNNLTVIALQNTKQDGSNVISGVSAKAYASGGGALAGNGAVSYATITPTVYAYSLSGASLAAGDTITIKALAYNQSYAEALGVSAGLVGIGAAVARATSQGTTEAYVDGDLAKKDTSSNVIGAAATSLSIYAKTTDKATAKTITGVGGIVAGGGSSAKAYANSTTYADVRANRFIYILEDIEIRAIGTPQSYAKADGYTAGGLSVGVSEALAESSPTINAWLGNNVTLVSGTRMYGSTSLTFTDNSDTVYLVLSKTNVDTGALTFTAGDSTTDPVTYDTISRATGSWITDGFIEGYYIRVVLHITTAANVNKDQYLVAKIKTVTDTTLTLATAGGFTTQTITPTTHVSGISNVNSFDVDLVYPVDNKITRTTGNWTAEGFKAGDRISISGTSLNNQIVTIKLISSDGKTLFFSADTDILDEVKNSGVSILLADEDVEGEPVEIYGDLVVSAQQGLPTDGSSSAYSEANAAGGALIGVNATSSKAIKNYGTQGDNTNAVSAYLGSNGSYNLTGDLTLAALTYSNQKAISRGYFGGIIAVGHNPAVASSYSDTLATISDGVSIHADTVYLRAFGQDTNYAESIAGMGGVVSISAAASSTTNTYSHTNTSLQDATITANTFKMAAYHNAIFNSKTDSINASLVGYSGGTATNNEYSKILINFGDASVTAASFYADADNNTTKVWLPGNAYNVKSGSGGLIDAPAASSITNITKYTDIIVGNGALLTQSGSQFDPGEFIFSINHDIYGRDKTSLDSGGAIAIAKAVSKIVANTDQAHITIGSGVSGNATIMAVGDVRFVILEKVDIETHANAKTYGLAGVAQGYSLSRVAPIHQITFNSDAYLDTKGNIHLYVGRDDEGHKNRYNLTAFTELWNWTAVPITVMDGSAEVEQTNKVVIQAGARLLSARVVYIRAEAGLSDILGHSKAIDTYSAGAGALVGDTSAFETCETSNVDNSDNGVVVNGTIDTGTQRSQGIRITANSYINFLTNGNDPVVYLDVVQLGDTPMTYTSGWESIATNVKEELDRLEELKSVYAGNDTAVEAYQSQIDQIISELLSQGIAVETITFTDPATAKVYTYYLVDSDITAYYITINETWAQAGEIYVDSDYLIGTGSLYANPNASITIENYGPFYIRVNALTIPSDVGGRIVFNDVAVKEVELKAKTPSEWRDYVNFANFTDPVTATPEPQINIKNKYAAGTRLYKDGVSYTSESLPTDILIAGNISNLRGSVTIENDSGSIMTTLLEDGESCASIDAGNISISAGRDFVQGYTDKFVHTGNDPAKLWASIIASLQTQTIPTSWTTTEFKAGTGEIKAGGRVYISARYLNVNGIVQSGRPEKTLVLDDTTALTIGAKILYYNTFKNYLNLDTSVVIYSNSDFTVFFNILKNRIEIANVKVEGGYVELHGQIINTGGGTINALSGYGKISITNTTGYDIVFNNLDTGRGVEGQVYIYDSNYKTTQNVVVNGVTKSQTRTLGKLYKSNGNTITVYTNESANFVFVQVTGTTGTITGRTTTYDTKAKQFYSWMTGQRVSTEITELYGSSSFWGCNGLAPDPDDQISRNVEYLDKVALLQTGSDYIQLLDSTSTFLFNSSSVNLAFSQTTKEWKESKGWWIFKVVTYYTRIITERTDKNFFSMRVKADYDIPINFIGEPNGGIVNIFSDGSVILNGNVGNSADNNGTVTICAGTESSTCEITNTSATVEQTGGKIYGKNVSITAGNGIGSNTSPIILDMKTGGSFSAVTTTGNVYVNESLGDLVINEVSTGDGKVVITVDGNLYATNRTSGSETLPNITANQIMLYSIYGAIGSTAQHVILEFVPATMMIGGTVVEDTFHNYIIATAPGNIFFTTINGDMPVRLIQSTGGNVTIIVSAGDILDRRFTQEIDTRAIQELKTLWDAMNLTGSAADAAFAQAVSAYLTSRESDYEAYWKFRKLQADGGATYDPTFVVPVTQAEKDLYIDQLGDTADIQAIVGALSQKRTNEYHALHLIYGVLGDTYYSDIAGNEDETWSYEDSVVYEPDFASTNVDVTNNIITLPNGHIFRDKQGVPYCVHRREQIPIPESVLPIHAFPNEPLPCHFQLLPPIIPPDVRNLYSRQK